MWPTYQPLLRADFTMFDEYTFTHTSSPPFEFPFMTFWGTRDRRVKEAHVRGWSKFAGGKFTIEAVEGNHLWPLDKAAKGVWLGRIAEELAQLGLEGSRSRSTGD